MQLAERGVSSVLFSAQECDIEINLKKNISVFAGCISVDYGICALLKTKKRGLKQVVGPSTVPE